MDKVKRRRGIILDLVRKCSSMWGSTRKVQVQKFIYFLQEVMGIKLGYRYEMYHYGPFCFELNDDLETMDVMGVINIEDNPSGYGFNISTGAYAGEPDAEDADFLRQHERAIEDIVEWGEMKAEKLEIISTVHFVDSILKRKKNLDDKKTVIEEVERLKPHFDSDYIGNVYDILDKANWLYSVES